jgi:hypothetical protein
MRSILYINGKVWQQNGKFEESFGIKQHIITFTGSNAEALQIKNKYEK